MQWWCAAQDVAWSWTWRPYPGVWIFIATLAFAEQVFASARDGDTQRLAELQAQIDDLRTGRTRAGSAPAVAAVAGSGAGTDGRAGAGEAGAAPGGVALPPEMVKLFDEALANLEAGRCDRYFDRQMSPNFRRTTGARALRTLVSACESRAALREQYMAAIRMARERTPRYEYAGTRAVFDMTGSGLPYGQWVVEQVDERWYIAE